MDNTAAAVVVELTRECNSCGEIKSADQFSGKWARCRPCVRAYQNDWRKKNLESVRASKAAWAERNPEYAKQWHQANQEKVRQYRRRQKEQIKIGGELRRIEAGKPLREPRTTPDGRLCSDCRTRQPAENFSPHGVYGDGLSIYCKPCASARSGKWAGKNKEKRREYMRRHDLGRAYGITPEQLEMMIAAQAGRCAVCREVLVREKRSTHVDHDHVTGKLRGILCIKCNAGLGQFRDNPDYLRAAAQYLLDHWGR